MQQYTNSIIQRINLSFTNQTRNTIFYSSTMTPIDHKHRIFDDTLKKSLGFPDHINNWYELHIHLGFDYSRLKFLTIVSACSDVEILFRDFVEDYFEKGINKRKSFYQRLNDVNSEIFLPKQIDLNSCGFFKNIKLGFQIRHIAIHNMGYIDQSFLDNTELDLELNALYQIPNDFLPLLLDSIDELMGYLDKL